MSTGNNSDHYNEKDKINAGAAALISVLAVPITILAGLLLSNKRKK